jgi:hypothetical protein
MLHKRGVICLLGILTHSSGLVSLPPQCRAGPNADYLGVADADA